MRPVRVRRIPAAIRASVAASTAVVGSWTTRTPRSAARARARATRWRWPPESELPRSPIRPPVPPARAEATSSTAAASIAACGSLPAGAAAVTFSRRVPSKSWASCSATSSAERRAAGASSVRGTPSSSTLPRSGSQRRARQWSRVAASAGSVTTTPRCSPGRTVRSRASSPAWPSPFRRSPPGAWAAGSAVPPVVSPGAASTSAIRAAEARPLASSAPTQASTLIGPGRKRARPTAETRAPRPMESLRTRRPPTRATSAMNEPVSVSIRPVWRAAARAARTLASREAWLVAR